MRIEGLLLAAGAGRRRGLPKALVPGALTGAIEALTAGGCDRVTVVLGAAADRARPLVPAGVGVVKTADWADGMSASLRAGLAATTGEVVVVHSVDLPDVGPDVVRRLLAHAGPEALARAVYDGVPGHPVLFGRRHVGPAAASATGDRGARGYLASTTVRAVECGDLASGVDVDLPPAE
ncbi:MAG: NTP transferase domain-containing protein [Gordonia sp. (in: high G+C Gram-positive bacteria)]|uniref:nucleotidyltransferase family protein n=1 Tax=Gordonia sp. (in: high G+C Gram-positive bacteria) TaxID=84139 RepID=UPI0039E4F2B0